jgi:hypothetical protein
LTADDPVTQYHGTVHGTWHCDRWEVCITLTQLTALYTKFTTGHTAANLNRTNQQLKMPTRLSKPYDTYMLPYKISIFAQMLISPLLGSLI